MRGFRGCRAYEETHGKMDRFRIYYTTLFLKANMRPQITNDRRSCWARVLLSIHYLRRLTYLRGSVSDMLLRSACFLDQWGLEHLVVLCLNPWSRAIWKSVRKVLRRMGRYTREYIYRCAQHDAPARPTSLPPHWHADHRH
jgi:hypothetical protein